MLFTANRITRLVDAQLPKLMATLLDIEQVLAKHIDAVNIADGSITGALVADGALTPAKISGSPQTTSGVYTGDGVANRIVVALTWTPRFVRITRVSDGHEFFAYSDGTTPKTYYARNAAGAIVAGDANFQGIVAGSGVKSGSASGASNASNQSAVDYHYFAVR